MSADSQPLIKNGLLAALSAEEYQRLAPELELVCLPRQQLLYSPGELIEYAYFPCQAMISLTLLMEDGSIIEVGVVGKEGMTGLPICWGGDTSIQQAMVQIPGDAIRIKAELLKTKFAEGGQLQSLLLLYTQALFTQVAQTAACNRLHLLEKRLARWLLTVQDRIQSHEMLLTQEFLAQMLGTRRSGVTEAAGTLQKSGIIRYSRGKITILDRESLEINACECYRVINSEFARLLNLR